MAGDGKYGILSFVCHDVSECVGDMERMCTNITYCVYGRKESVYILYVQSDVQQTKAGCIKIPLGADKCIG